MRKTLKLALNGAFFFQKINQYIKLLLYTRSGVCGFHHRFFRIWAGAARATGVID